tara:strand:+ start:2457 stop:2714 length:258 start_codon:yes stop_codon:yes gene_type:complete
MSKEYLPHQKIEMLKPAKVSREFGIPIETLSYLREESLQSGKLRGPVFFKDENIILYRRQWVLDYIEQNIISFSNQKTKETQKKA